MPYKISIQRFNSYLKDLCELAGIDAPTEGKVYDKVKKRKVAKLYPKYQLITSHTCRRSFATNYYKKMPTPLLMATTGHSKESLFLAYIGEKEDKDADAKLMYKYALIAEEERRQELKKRKQQQKTVMKQVHKKVK
jgi:integrase